MIKCDVYAVNYLCELYVVPFSLITFWRVDQDTRFISKYSFNRVNTHTHPYVHYTHIRTLYDKSLFEFAALFGWSGAHTAFYQCRHIAGA